MATAKVEIKGDPKDFLAALEKSKRKIAEVRKDASEMTKGGNKLTAGAAALGGALGGAMGDAIMSALKLAFSKSKAVSQLLGGVTAGEMGIAFSNEIDALQDRAARLGMRGNEATLFAAETAAGTVGGMGAEKYNQMLQRVEMARYDVKAGTSNTAFGEVLDKIGLYANEDLDAQAFLTHFLEGIQQLTETEQVSALESAGFGVRNIGEARQMILDVAAVKATMQDMMTQAGGREAMQAQIEKSAAVAGQQEADYIKERTNLLLRVSQNQDSLGQLAKTMHEQTIATQNAMDNTMRVVETVQTGIAAFVDGLSYFGTGFVKSVFQTVKNVEIIADVAKVFDGQPRPKE